MSAKRQVSCLISSSIGRTRRPRCAHYLLTTTHTHLITRTHAHTHTHTLAHTHTHTKSAQDPVTGVFKPATSVAGLVAGVNGLRGHTDKPQQNDKPQPYSPCINALRFKQREQRVSSYNARSSGGGGLFVSAGARDKLQNTAGWVCAACGGGALSDFAQCLA